MKFEGWRPLELKDKVADGDVWVYTQGMYAKFHPNPDIGLPVLPFLAGRTMTYVVERYPMKAAKAWLWRRSGGRVRSNKIFSQRLPLP